MKDPGKERKQRVLMQVCQQSQDVGQLSKPPTDQKVSPPPAEQPAQH